MDIRTLIFEVHKFWYYSKQKQTELNATIYYYDHGENVAIFDKYGRIEIELDDIPDLIEILKRILKSK